MQPSSHFPTADRSEDPNGEAKLTANTGELHSGRANSCRIVGLGRAGLSFRRALTAAGWDVDGRGHSDQLDDAADGVGLVLLTVPDGAIADVAAKIRPGSAVVAHVSGASDLSVLHPHHRTASIHPLVSLPDLETGSERLSNGCTFAIDGHPIAAQVVSDLGGRAIVVPADLRPLYHAVACIAANHLAALGNQVETLAAKLGVPVEAYWSLMTTTLENMTTHGSEAALTGPASRGDWETIERHLAALDNPEDRRLYQILSERAAVMAGQSKPIDDLPREDSE